MKQTIEAFMSRQICLRSMQRSLYTFRLTPNGLTWNAKLTRKFAKKIQYNILNEWAMDFSLTLQYSQWMGREDFTLNAKYS